MIDDSELLAIVSNHISPIRRFEISKELKSVLENESEGVSSAEIEVEQPESRGSILFGRDTSNSAKLVAFSFSNTLKESRFNLLGLLLAASGHMGPKQFQQALSLATTLWSNLIVLKSPQDEDAIVTARAIGILTLRAKWERDFPGAPSADILDITRLSQSQLSMALKKLHDKHIIKSTEWGAQAGDYTHSANRWMVGF